MSSRERPIDRASRKALADLGRIGDEIRASRTSRGLSTRTVALAVGVSNAQVSRIERGQAARVPFWALARLASAVGLELSVRAYPGAGPVRDLAHARLLDDLRARLHPSLTWSTEVPLPTPGDQRAWDALIAGPAWRFGVEAETAPRDAQALVRRVHLKARDSVVDGVLLALRDTRTTREFLEAGGPSLRTSFTFDSRRVFAALRAGARPSGDAIVIVPRGSTDARPRPRLSTVTPDG
jgi:transcriptional regulator with XRE-family HTH domain